MIFQTLFILSYRIQRSAYEKGKKERRKSSVRRRGEGGVLEGVRKGEGGVLEGE